MMKWESLVKLEPRLRNVERLAEDANVDGLCWADFWLQAKLELDRLVGILAGQPGLRSLKAYEVCMKHVQTVWAIGSPRDKCRSARPWDGASDPWWADDAAEVATA